MAEVTIPDVDEELIRTLDDQARAEGVTLEQLAARLLSRGASSERSARRFHTLIADIAWQRRSQAAQTDDAAADVRALRDGTTAGAEASQAG